MDVTLGAALLAGLLSFLSPCVLPVVPAYLAQLGIVAVAKPAGLGNTSLASVGEIAIDGGFSPAPAPATAVRKSSGSFPCATQSIKDGMSAFEACRATSFRTSVATPKLYRLATLGGRTVKKTV